MSLLRCGKLLKGITSTRYNKLFGINSVQHRCASGDDRDIPEYYDLTHLEGERQCQPMDWKEFPLDPERRAKLAKKYNLRPEDYVPLMDSDITLGDYPRLPQENCLARDPFYDWDDEFHRRNYGEPIFHDMGSFTPVVGPDTRPLMFDRPQMWKVFLSCFFGIVGLFMLGHMFPTFLPRAPKQYPEHYPKDDNLKVTHGFSAFEEYGANAKFKTRKNVVHYTFPKEWDPAAH